MRRTSPWSKLSIAPMMGHTNRFGRFVLRQLAPKAQLFTEMLVDRAILNGPVDDLLAFDPCEHPVIAQLAGNQTQFLTQAARKVEQFGYDGVNLNIGCPSVRLLKGQMGACLFHQPQLVADLVTAIQNAVDIPVSIKCRIGTESANSYEDFHRFIETVSHAKPDSIYIHSRIAVLNGMSTTQNLRIPPLRYDFVERIKQHFTHMRLVLNGGLNEIAKIEDALRWVDGVMLGRVAVSNPRTLHQISATLEGTNSRFNPYKVLNTYTEFLAHTHIARVPQSTLVQPVLNLFDGVRGAKAYRKRLTSPSPATDSIVETLQDAARIVKKQSVADVQQNQSAAFL